VPSSLPPQPNRPTANVSPSVSNRTPAGIDPKKMAYGQIAGMYLYSFDVRMGDTDLHSISHLMHPQLFASEKLQSMAEAACVKIFESRITLRRRGMAGQPIRDPKAVNEDCFAQDAEFFEVVMCDLYGFKIFKSQGVTSTKVSPTIVNAGEAHGQPAV